MTSITSDTQIIERRGVLLAELFLQDLEPTFVVKSTTDMGYDFLVGMTNRYGGVNNYAVQVRITEQPVSSHISVPRASYQRLAYSNLPALMLVVDVKQNQLFYAWLSPATAVENDRQHTIQIPLIEVNNVVKEQLRQTLAETTQPIDRLALEGVS